MKYYNNERKGESLKKLFLIKKIKRIRLHKLSLFLCPLLTMRKLF